MYHVKLAHTVVISRRVRRIVNMNRGKQFEQIIREDFGKAKNTSVIRLPDPVQGYLGYRNVCDFIVYHYPNQYFIECKTINRDSLPFSNITKNQWTGMLEMSKIDGVIAGVICWFIPRDTTLFIPIQLLERYKNEGRKSVSYKDPWAKRLLGRKKRLFFTYDMEQFFNQFKQ